MLVRTIIHDSTTKLVVVVVVVCGHSSLKNECLNLYCQETFNRSSG